jgi:hypothetical protein
MTQQYRAPEPSGNDWQTWARRLTQYLSQVRSTLVQQTGGESAADDATLMWDREKQYPVVSKGGEWRQIVVSGGHYAGGITADQTAASSDTAYALTYTSSVADRVANGTPASRIVFDEAGQYMVSFSAQIASTSSSTVNFYFWPRINGSDVSGSTMVNALHQNGAVLVVSRTAIFDVSAGDYLEAMWAVDSTSGFLNATAATSFSPAAPASTIAITRVHA